MIDPNVLVSAAVSSHGPPRRIIHHYHRGAFGLIASEELLLELQAVLLRQKFRRYFGEDETLEYILWLHDGAVLYSSVREAQPVATDPEDDYLVNLTQQSSADYLVSGDPHLTEPEGEELLGIRVLTPRAFCEKLEEEGSLS